MYNHKFKNLSGTFMLYKAYLRKAHFVDLYHMMEYYETLKLFGQYRMEFAKKTKFFANYILLIVTLGQIGFALIYVLLTGFLIYMYANMYMVISSILWLPSTLIAIRTVGAHMLTSFYYVYIISLYLKLRFRQIYDSLKTLNVHGNNYKHITISHIVYQLIDLSLKFTSAAYCPESSNTTSAVG